MLSTMLLQAEEATGEFDPVGTIVTLLLILGLGYGAWLAYQRSQSASGFKSTAYIGATILGGGVALLLVVAFVMNLAAAV